MGQCCGKESQEIHEEEERGELSHSSIAPLVTSEEAHDVTLPEIPAPTQVEEELSDSESALPSPDTSLPSPPEGNYLNYPILQDRRTMEYVQKSKVMVILKGLPGSGKSYIADTLKQIYRDAVICSADNYFMKDGQYKFSVDKLKFAHQSCQENAKAAAVSGAPMIIIDNTNLQLWNYKYYLKLSKSHCYTPIIVEPQTPWAKSTKQLAKRNSHGISKEILDQKLSKYEPVLPLYYWWFLNEEDSSHILTMAQEWLKKLLQVQEFFNDFSEFSKLSSIEDMIRYYRRNEGQGSYKVLHATASVTRKGKAKNAEEYMGRKAVKRSLGKLYILHIIGFVLTPRTFGVRLRLGGEALAVWGMDEEEQYSEATDERASHKPPQQSGKEGEYVTIPDTGLREGSCHSTLKSGKSLVHTARYHPTSGQGSRAHLTLGCAPGVQAKVTGFDLMKVISREQSFLESREDCSDMYESFSIPDGELRTYGDNIWVVYPEREIDVSSLFSAFY